jgi:thiosulfate/3-mercaptopyruvate sulfurtransferase
MKEVEMNSATKVMQQLSLGGATRIGFLALACLLTSAVIDTQVEAARGQQDPKELKKVEMLIEPGELANQLDLDGLRILDTRPSDQYTKGHIPGAVSVNVPAWQELGKTPGGFRNVKAWSEKVGQLGITNNSRVVVYGKALPDAGRIWWTLKYLGIEEVMLLNGGWDAWVKESRPTVAVVPKIVATRFEPRFQADRLEEIESLKEAVTSGKVKVVDTRSSDEFTGKEVRGKRGGHIPGAAHLEWKELLAEDGRFKNRDQLRELFREHGIKSDESAVCYCQSGGRASVEAFALELAGYPAVKLFVGGWEQWGADTQAKAEK